jgi:hypothetical protein
MENLESKAMSLSERILKSIGKRAAWDLDWLNGRAALENPMILGCGERDAQ